MIEIPEHLQDAHRLIPKLTLALAGGPLDGLYARLCAWTVEDLQALRAEMPVFYREMSLGVETSVIERLQQVKTATDQDNADADLLATRVAAIELARQDALADIRRIVTSMEHMVDAALAKAGAR